MSFRKMEVGHRFRRIKHNLQTKKTTDEELKLFDNVMLRNTKVANFASTFRKDLAGTLSTGFKEENVDKRKKKVEELTLAQDLREASVDLDYLQTSCLHKVINTFGSVLHCEVDEKVKLEMALERRVYEEMGQFVDYEKNLNKWKDKLNLLSTDLEIAQKDLDKEATMNHQETCDAIQMKYEGMKDSMVTDIFTGSVPREFQINEHVLTCMTLKRDYFKKMWELYDRAIPEVEKTTATATPRPVFGVPLEDHLSTYGEQISDVLSKTCDFLRQHGMKERGIFRVSGNTNKVKRIVAALDAGQFEQDEKHYQNDPHAVASALKAYLRELPDPLTTNALANDWVEAISSEGEEKFAAIDRCLKKMPRGHRQNLTYLLKFLYDLETHKDDTSMNASNLAIVFAPTITGMVYDGMNTFAVQLIEFMITNGSRIFNFGPLDKLDTSPPSGFTRAQLSISPRSFRPKERAPPPPAQSASTSADLIDFHGNGNDYDDFSDEGTTSSSEALHGGSLTRSNTEHRPHRPPPPAFRTASTTTPKSRPISYNIAVGARQSAPPKAETALPKVMTTSLEETIPETPVAPERKRLSMISIGGSSKVAPNNNSHSSSQESSTGSLVIDGGDNRTLVSLDGESSTAAVLIPSIIQPPPQATKPKPPLPVKPKDLKNESSRL